MTRRRLYSVVGLVAVLGLIAVVFAAILLRVATADLLGDPWQSVQITGVGHEAVLSLSPRYMSANSVSGLSVWITGEIDGEAEVWAGNWAPQRLKGQVDWRVYHDWFQPDCQLHYRPVGAASGKLKVSYQFH